MDFLGPTDFEKMVAENDVHALFNLLNHHDSAVRLRAAEALIDLDQESGWEFLSKAVTQDEDPDVRATAAEILADTNDPRAVPPLEKALAGSTGDLAGILKSSIQAIEGPEAEEALRRSGYEPVLPHLSGLQIPSFEGDYIRSVLPDTSEIQFLTAEQHLNNAADLREAELAERGLVEDSIVLWLSPEMEYAWYLRGVLFEDLDRYTEAALCYRWALELNPMLHEAREAAADLQSEYGEPEDDEGQILGMLASNGWKERRDGAALVGDLGENAPEVAVPQLIELLKDDEREVRHAAIEALGNIGDRRALQPLIELDESSWLLRFAVLEALAQFRSVDGLWAVLHRQMDEMQERNPAFSREKDPLLEVEYGRLMEIGVLAFERTRDLEALLALAEENEWVEVEDEDEEFMDEETAGSLAENEAAEQFSAGEVSGEEDPEGEDEELEYEELEDEDLEDEDFDEDDVDVEEIDAASDNLSNYVDEVSRMACLALERLAMPVLAQQSRETLERLAVVPDFTLLPVTGDEDEEELPAIIHDFTTLREAARVELARRSS